MDDLAFEQIEKWLDPDYGILYKEPPPEKVYDSKSYKIGLFEHLNVKDNYLIGKV